MPTEDMIDHERCPVCSSDKRGDNPTFAPSHYYECGNCHALVRKDLRTIDDYPERYYLPNRHIIVRIANFLLSRPSLAWKKRIITRFAQRSGSVFDVGCGDASFLRALPHSLRRVGYEPNNRTAVQGVEIAETLEQPPESFDVITMWHVLEHISDPRQVMAATLPSLKPSGVLLLGLPNPHGLGASVSASTWFHLDATHHKVHYPFSALSALLGNDYLITRDGFAWECPFDVSRTLAKRAGILAPLAFAAGLALKAVGAIVGKPETYVAVIQKKASAT